MRFFSCILLILGLLATVIQAKASHIVGGEFELIHLEGNRYRLNLILYSDDINIMDPAAIDPVATVHIWRKRNNTRVRSITLNKLSDTPVPYTNPDCAIPELSTSKVVYSTEITLDAATYNSKEGYYINYERCCRNGVINNIQMPGETGQAFYMEFPAVVKDGEPFINSSPYLFPPLSDFARLGYPFYFDFKGSDADGDSLVYTLTTPLAGSSSPAPGNVLPPPKSAPYDKVRWAAGYNVDNIIPGSPPLRISQEGLIQLTPTQTGLFVFSVLVEEYRDGEKIGEVRRDFQMLVYDYQGSDYPPELSARKPSDGQSYRNEITLTDADFSDFANERCLTLEVQDEDVDAEGAPQNGHEPISFRVVPVNFSGSATNDYLSVSEGSVNRDQRSFSLDLCLPLCPPTDNGPYIFDIVAYDDACALPLTDTLRVTVDVDSGIRNQKPKTASSISTSSQETVNLHHTLGETIQFNVTGNDPDNDLIHLRAEGDGFALETYGMEFSSQDGLGPLQSSFTWQTACSNVPLPEKNYFTVFFITEDEDLCNQASGDTLTVNIAITAPPNDKPAIEIVGLRDLSLTANVDTSMVFELKGYDPNSEDMLTLRLDSISSSNGNNIGYSWQDTQNQGEVLSILRLAPDCDVFANGVTDNSFIFYFSVEDSPCYNQKTDTLSLRVDFSEKLATFSDVHFPNVFTPNGDELNDVFEILGLPEGSCYNRFEQIQVFNRWGRVLFESNDLNFKWDGGDYPTGTYYYQIRYTRMSHRSDLSLIRGDNPSSTQR